MKEGEKYYLFGEFKTDDENKYNGFSCYSTQNFVDWKFEGLSLPLQNNKTSFLNIWKSGIRINGQLLL